jgi:hypothetical protein
VSVIYLDWHETFRFNKGFHNASDSVKINADKVPTLLNDSRVRYLDTKIAPIPVARYLLLFTR